MKPVEVTDDHRVNGAFADVVEHLAIARANPTGVGADVCVHVPLSDVPALALRQRLAVGKLARDRQLLAFAVG